MEDGGGERQPSEHVGCERIRGKGRSENCYWEFMNGVSFHFLRVTSK